MIPPRVTMEVQRGSCSSMIGNIRSLVGRYKYPDSSLMKNSVGCEENMGFRLCRCKISKYIDKDED